MHDWSIFFFSSRRRHTRLVSDWSSDVCSSDLATLRERYDMASVIMPSIVPRKAPFKEGYAHWDGVSEPVTGGGSLLFNSSIFNPNIGYSGQLEANSLKLRVLDGTGKLLYQGLGGVQLTEHLDHGQLVLVPES